MKILIILFSTCAALAAYAQKSETMERANAVRFPSTGQLVIKFDNNATDIFQYQAPGKIPLQEIPKYFSYPTRNANLEVQALFINPLKYRLTLRARDSDDPNYKVESEFVALAAPPITTASGPGVSLAGLNFSVLIPEWFEALEGATGYVAGAESTVESKLAPIEDFLAGNFSIGGTTANFEGHLTNAITLLEAAQNHTTYEARKSDADFVRQHIQGFKNGLDQRLNDIASDMRGVTGVTYDASFTKATNNAVRRLKLLVTEFTRAKFILFDQYKKLLDEIDQVSFSGSNIQLTNPYVKLKAQKDLILNITAVPLTVDKSNFSVKEGEKKEIEFHVILRRPQVEASAGAAWIYQGITFNAFSATADSTSFKLSNAETTRYLLPVLFLNVYRNASLTRNKTSEHLLILPQLGVGTGKELPTLLIGGGYVIPHKFIVSAGVVNAWTQRLKDGYSLHGPLTREEADDISTVYEYQWKVKFYLSVQFKL